MSASTTNEAANPATAATTIDTVAPASAAITTTTTATSISSSSSIVISSSELSSASSSSSSTTPMDTSATPTIRMKKVRKRNQFKSSTTPLEDEKDDEAAEMKESTQLHAIRAIQELRQKKATVYGLGETSILAEQQNEAAAASSSAAIAAAASSGEEEKDVQTQLIEDQMEKYIAEQLAARKASRMPQNTAAASSASASSTAASSSAVLPVNLSDDQLFVTPAHLALRPTRTQEEAEESGERWLTGISEQPLSIRDKMANIEATERAKQAFLEAEAKRRRDAAGALILPANYNSNFRLHKKEWDAQRRDEVRDYMNQQARSSAIEQGLPVPLDSIREPMSMSQQANQLPGFLAVGAEERRDRGAGGNRGGATSNRPAAGAIAASDDRVVDRFIKRFKHK